MAKAQSYSSYIVSKKTWKCLVHPPTPGQISSRFDGQDLECRMGGNRPKRIYVSRSLFFFFFVSFWTMTTGQMTAPEELTVAAWHCPGGHRNKSVGSRQFWTWKLATRSCAGLIPMWWYLMLVLFLGLVSGCLWERRCKSFMIFKLFGSVCMHLHSTLVFFY